VQRRIYSTSQPRLSWGARRANPARRPLRTLGISLLETLAALVILSAGTAVLLTWFSQNAALLGRLKQTEEIERGKLLALDYIRAINPVERPSGDIALGAYRMAWTSKVSVAPERALTAMGTPGRYEISLYDLDIQLARLNSPNEPPTRISLPVAGYKLVGGSSAGGMFSNEPAPATQ
jgi:general secretion pathway protein I